MQMVQSVILMVLPALLASKFAFGKYFEPLRLKKPNTTDLLLAFAFAFLVLPAIAMFTNLNNAVHLPDFMNGFEVWARAKESEIAVLTEQMLATDSINGLIINIIIIALGAAVGEELLFRGFIQKVFETKMNYHLAIWLTAFIFAAIHVQFFGIVPRMLLGAAFGYMAVWSGSLWLPVLAHFTNNAIGIVGFYLNHNSIVGVETDHFSYSIGIFSLFASLLILFLIKKKE